jgi:hypothetical protein
MKYTVKKLRSGMYQYTFSNNLVFNVVNIRDGNSSDNSKWYYVNADSTIDEGGSDWYTSKNKALAALVEYVPCRRKDSMWGWVFDPSLKIAP